MVLDSLSSVTDGWLDAWVCDPIHSRCTMEPLLCQGPVLGTTVAAGQENGQMLLSLCVYDNVRVGETTAMNNFRVPVSGQR